MPKSRLFRLGLVALATLAASPLTACIVDVAGTPYAGRPPVSGNPVINAIAANPTSIADKDAAITFTVNTSDPAGQGLQYTWSATKGTLSATTGQTVFWRPVKSDGSLEAPGLATVTLLVTNARGGTASSSVNLSIKDNGATDVGTSTSSPAPAASPSASPSAATTPAPSASPSASASPVASASPSASPAPSESPAASASPSPSPSPSASASPAAE